MYIFSLQRIKF